MVIGLVKKMLLLAPIGGIFGPVMPFLLPNRIWVNIVVFVKVGFYMSKQLKSVEII